MHSLIYFADVYGATLPGKASAQIVFIFIFSAFSKSTPPGFEAKSIINVSFFTLFNLSSFNIIFGIVLNIIS